MFKFKIGHTGVLNKLIMIMIAVSCIFNQYQAPVATVGLLISFVLTTCLIFKKKKLVLDKELLILYSIIFAQQLLCVFYVDLDFLTFIKQLITMLIIVIITSMSFEVRDFNQLYKILKIVGLIVTIAVMIQAVQVYILHQAVSPITLFNVGEDSNWIQSGRPMGFFSEVQVYCTSVLPIFAFSILKKDYKFSVFVALGILLSGSSLGILTMLFVVGYFIIISDEVSKNIKLLFIVLGIISVALFFSLSIFSNMREKIFSIFNEFSGLASAKIISSFSYSNYLRLFKAFDTFTAYPLLQKTFGTGCLNTINYLNSSNISVKWYSIWNTNDLMSAYYTTGFGVFIECGLIVGIIYYCFFIKKYKGANSYGKIIISLLLFQGFITQLFFNGLFTYYLLLFYAVTTKDNIKKIGLKC